MISLEFKRYKQTAFNKKIPQKQYNDDENECFANTELDWRNRTEEEDEQKTAWAKNHLAMKEKPLLLCFSSIHRQDIHLLCVWIAVCVCVCVSP